MKHIAAFALMVLAVGSVAAVASVLEMPSGERIEPTEYSVFTRIDGRIAVTDVVEEFSLDGVLSKGQHADVVLYSIVDPSSSVIALSVGYGGRWLAASTETQIQSRTTPSAAPIGVTHFTLPQRALRVPIRMQVGDAKVIRTKVTYTEVLTATTGQLQYHLPQFRQGNGTATQLRSWTVDVASPIALSGVYTSNGDVANVAQNGRTARLERHWSSPVSTQLKPIMLYITVVDTRAFSTDVVNGWHGDQEYAVIVGSQQPEPNQLNRPTQKIWVVLDDHFSGHESYASFKRFYQETIDLLRPDDDYDVFQLTHKLFFSWRNFLTRFPESPLDAMAWSMQSNGYGQKSKLVRPADWILDMPANETRGLDVIFLTHDVRGGLGAAVSAEQITQLQQRGIRLFTIAQSAFPADLRSLETAAAETGAAFIVNSSFQDPKEVCKSVFDRIRMNEDRVLDCRTSSPDLSETVQWSSDGSRSPESTIIAMRVNQRTTTSVDLAGYRNGARHSWSIGIDLKSASGTSSMVPLLWASAFCDELERIYALSSDVPSVQAEVASEIARIGMEFQIPTQESSFRVDLTNEADRIP